MPRKPLIRTSLYPYHVTNRSNNREIFYLPAHLLWPIFLENLGSLEKDHGCRIHIFVLMGNHYHLLLDTPKANLGEAMKYFHREVARQANHKAQRINHFFGGRYKWSLIQCELYYWNAFKYILRNPVAAGLAEKVEHYRFSQISGQAPAGLLKIPDFFDDRSQTLDLNFEWLNTPYTREETELIRKGLRKRAFEIGRQANGSSGQKIFRPIDSKN